MPPRWSKRPQRQKSGSCGACSSRPSNRSPSGTTKRTSWGYGNGPTAPRPCSRSSRSATRSSHTPRPCGHLCGGGLAARIKKAQDAAKRKHKTLVSTSVVRDAIDNTSGTFRPIDIARRIGLGGYGQHGFNVVVWRIRDLCRQGYIRRLARGRYELARRTNKHGTHSTPETPEATDPAHLEATMTGPTNRRS